MGIYDSYTFPVRYVYLGPQALGLLCRASFKSSRDRFLHQTMRWAKGMRRKASYQEDLAMAFMVDQTFEQ